MRLLQSLAIALVALTCFVGCGTGDKSESSESVRAPKDSGIPDLARGWVTLHVDGGEHRVRVEVARTHKERARGLMYRKALASGSGMLFIFNRERDQTFWMKNTLIALDMIFIRQDMTIAGIVHEAEPLTLTQRSIGKPSLFVLEVPGGWAKQHAIEAGQRVSFQDVD